MKVLLSIKPEYVKKIFSGEKRYEYRKSIYKNHAVDTIVVYCTMPMGKIVGEFKVEKIIQDNPINIWNTTKAYSGVEKSFFKQYFKGRDKGFAIKINSTKLYDTPIDPKEKLDNFTAPQSFRYIDESIEKYIYD